MRIQDCNQIGRLVKATRKKKKLSQVQLAAKAMVSLRWLVSLENGQNLPQLDLVLRTLTALGLGIEIQPLRENPLNEILSQ